MSLHKLQVDQISKGFIKYLDKTGQLGLLPELARQNLRQSKIQFDPHLAKVQTPISLTPEQIIDLEAALSRLFHRSIKVKNTLNHDLIGGMFIRIADKVIDTSLRTKLDTLQETLTYASH